VTERLGKMTFADADRASNIVPILRFSRLPFITGFTHVTVSVSAVFVNMGFVANARMLSNSATAHQHICQRGWLIRPQQNWPW